MITKRRIPRFSQHEEDVVDASKDPVRKLTRQPRKEVLETSVRTRPG